MRTLLRYPGGKSRAVSSLKEFIPEDINEICSPFFGGGALEIYLADKGVRVYGYDIFEPLVNFWKHVISDAYNLAAEVELLFPMSKDMFYTLQKTQDKINPPIKRAAVFYALNRASFSGSTLSGGMSLGHPRFTKSSIQRIKEFSIDNLSVDRLDFKDSIKKHRDTFLYCDPPYFIESSLYGIKGSTQKNFDHEGLAELLKNRDGWILSYNDCEYIRKLYSGYKFEYPSWAYGMSKSKRSNEILILSS